MTNTREEAAAFDEWKAKYYEDDEHRYGFIAGYQAAIAASNSKYVAGLVEALKRIAESEYDYITGQHSDEIAEEALNNLPEELRG